MDATPNLSQGLKDYLELHQETKESGEPKAIADSLYQAAKAAGWESSEIREFLSALATGLGDQDPDLRRSFGERAARITREAIAQHVDKRRVQRSFMDIPNDPAKIQKWKEALKGWSTGVKAPKVK